MNVLDVSAGPAGIDDLKRAHRGTWASGSYATVAERLIDDVPPRHLLDRVGIEPGTDVLDIATGTGNVAIKAARVGARVTGLDLTPELFGRGRQRAAEAGVEIEWVEGDAEALPFEDASFDRVLSTFGIQFAPRHEVAAREAVRVARPGATIGLIAWTPQSLLGQVLKTVGSRLPKPPEYASPPPLWGDEDHVHELFAGTGAELEFERAVNPIVDFDAAEDWVEFMAVNYGPLLKARERLSAEGTWADLREELVELTASFDRGGATGIWLEAEYLLALVHLPTG